MARFKKHEEVDWSFPESTEDNFFDDGLAGISDDLTLTNIDPRFEKLIEYNEAKSSFEINMDGFRRLFAAENSLRVHACIGHYSNSNLISKMLDYAVSLGKSSGGNDEDLSQVFVVGSEGVIQKCIVAWGQPVSCGELVDGKPVYHIFLDIWGQFETDDPMYLIFAGICTALTSCVVHIQKIELEESAWKWIHNVALVARKVLGQYSLEQLLFFVTDWVDASQFMPGERGGREYLTSFFDGTCSKDRELRSRIINLKEQFRTISCYLFPSYLEKQLALKQHVVASKKFLLSEGSSLEFAKTAVLEDILLSLEKPHNYLNYVVEVGKSIGNVEREVEKSISIGNVEDSKRVEAIKDSKTNKMCEVQSNACPTEEVACIGIAKNPEHVFTVAPEFDFLSADCIDIEASVNFFDSDFNFSPSEEAVGSVNGLFEVQRKSSLSSVPEKRLTFQEFLKSLQPVQSSSNECHNSTCKDESEVQDSDADNPQKVSVSYLEELKSTVIPKNSLELLKNQIKIPPISLSKVHQMSTKEPLVAVARHQNNHLRNVVDEPTTFISEIGKVCDIRSPLEPQDKASVAVTSTSTTLNDLNDIIIVEGANFVSTVELEELFSTQLDKVFAKAVQEVEKKVSSKLTSSQQDFLKSQLTEYFSSLNTYIDEMDKQFEHQIYFVETSNLRAFSRQTLQKLKNNTTIRNEEMWNVVHQKMLVLENMYININDDIQTQEAENAGFASNLALQLYQRKMTEIPRNSAEEISEEHMKWSKLSKEAFFKSYNGHDETAQSYVAILHDKLEAAHVVKLSEFKTSDEPKVIQNLIMQISSRFGSEVDRGVLRNASISDEAQALEMIRTYRSNSERHFSSSISSLTNQGREELVKQLKKELDCISIKKLTEFKMTQRSYPHSSRSYANVVRPDKLAHSSSKSRSDQMEVDDDDLVESPSDINAQVGVHFGFETLSAVRLIDNKFRPLYGPSPNVINFTRDEIILGDLPIQSARLELKSVLNQTDLKRQTDVQGWKSYHIEELLSIILSRLHLIVSMSLHSENIAYVIAVPSGFNSTMIDVMGDAIQIAGIEATVIREVYGLMTRFIYDQPTLFRSPTSAVSIVENTDESADAMGFYIRNRELTPDFLLGYDKCTHSRLNPKYWFLLKFLSSEESSLGFTRIMNNIAAPSKLSHPRIILECSNQNMKRNTDIFKAIKDSSQRLANWKLNLLSNSKPTIVEGAALVACYKYNPSFKSFWNSKNLPSLETSIHSHCSSTSKDFFYRLLYTGSRLDCLSVLESSGIEKSARDEHKSSLEKLKSEAKKRFLEKSNQIQDREIAQSIKEELSSKCSELVQRINSEVQSLSILKQLIEEINHL